MLSMIRFGNIRDILFYYYYNIIIIIEMDMGGFDI